MTVTTLKCNGCGDSDAVVGIQIWGVYDGVLFWQCDRCGQRWHRWEPEHWLHERAREFVEKRKLTD